MRRNPPFTGLTVYRGDTSCQPQLICTRCDVGWMLKEAKWCGAAHRSQPGVSSRPFHILLHHVIPFHARCPLAGSSSATSWTPACAPSAERRASGQVGGRGADWLAGWLAGCLPACRLAACLTACLPACLASWLPACLPAAWLPACLAAWLPACLPSCLPARLDWKHSCA